MRREGKEGVHDLWLPSPPALRTSLSGVTIDNEGLKAERVNAGDRGLGLLNDQMLLEGCMNCYQGLG